MTNIYKPPNSNLDLPEVTLGPMPLVIKVIFILFCIEELITLASNYTPTFGEKGLEVYGPESIFVVAITVLIIGYIWRLLKNGRVFVKTITKILLAINMIPLILLPLLSDVEFSSAEILTIISSAILMLILHLFKHETVASWLIKH